MVRVVTISNTFPPFPGRTHCWPLSTRVCRSQLHWIVLLFLTVFRSVDDICASAVTLPELDTATGVLTAALKKLEAVRHCSRVPPLCAARHVASSRYTAVLTHVLRMLFDCGSAGQVTVANDRCSTPGNWCVHCDIVTPRSECTR